MNIRVLENNKIFKIHIAIWFKMMSYVKIFVEKMYVKSFVEKMLGFIFQKWF